GISIFSWCASILTLIGRKWPNAPAQLIGVMHLPSAEKGGSFRIPRPGLMLAGTCAVVLGACAFAIPWTGQPLPKDRPSNLLDRLKSGITFEYNTRALMPKDQTSVKLQDEINRRFAISSDPTAIYTRTL